MYNLEIAMLPSTKKYKIELDTHGVYRIYVKKPKYQDYPLPEDWFHCGDRYNLEEAEKLIIKMTTPKILEVAYYNIDGERINVA